MPFDLHPAIARLRHLHGEPLPFRRALLDVAFAAGCPVSEQAVALEHGDAVTLRMASAHDAPVRTQFVVLDLEHPARGARWPAHLDSLGGPNVAQTWVVALHTLLLHAQDQPWELLYTRGPAIGVPSYVRERLGQSDATVLLVPCPTQPTQATALDGVALTVRRAENVWRLPACDWTVRVEGQGEHVLRQLHDWLRALPEAWTLHQLTLQGERLSAILRTVRPVTPPAGLTLHELSTLPPLSFPINDALLAWPTAWLPQPLAARTLPDGLWLAGLTAPIADDAPLPEQVGALALEWQVEQVAREAAAALLVAVSAAESGGPAPAGLDSAVWRLPGEGEVDAAVRGLTARLRKMFTA